MLRSMNDLQNFTLSAEDGETGTVGNLCFDDALDHPMPDRRRGKPVAWPAGTDRNRHGAGVDWDGKTVSVALTCDQVKVTSYYGLPPYSTLPTVGHEEAQKPSAGEIRNDFPFAKGAVGNGLLHRRSQP
jgi:hypothetical protein